MNSKDLREIVDFLSIDIGARSYKQVAQMDRAAEYIAGRFADYGYTAQRQAFTYNGNTYANIFAELAGTGDRMRS